MTVVELKRKVTVGTILDLKHYSGWSPGPRKVVFINSAGFTLQSADGTKSNCDWPKAKDLVEKSNGFTIRSNWFDRIAQKEVVVELLTYTFIESKTNDN